MYFIIGIGGTGARCIEAFVHLCGAGLLNSKDQVHIIHVDADVSCGNLEQAQTLVKEYGSLHKEKGMWEENGLFQNQIVEHNVWNPVPEGVRNLDDYFNSRTMGTDAKNHSYKILYDALFTEQEKTTPLDKGFRGHPPIGAAIIANELKDAVAHDSMWQEIQSLINQGDDNKVFIFGSAFGGTGAAGFPTVARVLRDGCRKRKDAKSTTKFGGALILPYFYFPDPDPTSPQATEMQAKVGDFLLNTQAALNYYKGHDIRSDVYDAIYFVGDTSYTKVNENCVLGGSEQKNNPHFVELYAALAAYDFFNRDEYDANMTPMIARGDDNNINWSDIPEGEREELRDYTKFLYAFRELIYTGLKDYRENDSWFKRDPAWIKKYIKNEHVDIKDNGRGWQFYEKLYKFSAMYFNWLMQIEGHDDNSCTVRLLNQEVMNKPWQHSANRNLEQVVYGESDLNYTTLLTRLTDMKKVDPNDTGTGVVLHNLYNLVSD